MVRNFSGRTLPTDGGYPPDWIVAGNILIMAYTDENSEPHLVIEPVDQFIKGHQEAPEGLINEDGTLR